MSISDRFDQAIATFDKYNASDPHQEVAGDNSFPKESAIRSAHERTAGPVCTGKRGGLAACRQKPAYRPLGNSKGRIPSRQKGISAMKNAKKSTMRKLQRRIPSDCGYENEIIEKVKFLLLKKELHKNADTQLLEDIICLVFVQYYLDEFAAKHDDEKVVDILRKTIKKMSPKAIEKSAAFRCLKK